jgi:hypothetical protein
MRQQSAGRRQMNVLVRVVLLLSALTAPMFCVTRAVAQDQSAAPMLRQELNDADVWRAVREGIHGSVTIPDKKAGILIQSSGETWRAIHNGPLPEWGAWGMLGMIILLALFFAIRGRIRIEEGPSGERSRAVQFRRPARPLADGGLVHHSGADRPQHALRPLRYQTGDWRRCICRVGAIL